MTEPVHRAAPGAPLWAAGSWRWVATPDRRLLLLSVVLQLALAVVFGHSYDTRVFMAAGYLAGTGQTRTSPRTSCGVFHHSGFNVRDLGRLPAALAAPGARRSSIASPTPWSTPSVCTTWPSSCRSSPPISGSPTSSPPCCRSSGAHAGGAARAWVFLLFNPLLLYVGAAWGQIDAIVALLALAALAARRRGRRSARPAARPGGLRQTDRRSRCWSSSSPTCRAAGPPGAVRYGVLFVAGVLVFYVPAVPRCSAGRRRGFSGTSTHEFRLTAACRS